MPTDIIMPQMGESIVEGTITKWLKKPGDKVQRDEPLFEISTDKVDAEIPAPASGVLQEIKVTEGTTVGVNTVVGTIAVDGEAAAAPAKAATVTPASEKPAAKAEEKKTEEKSPAPAPPPAPAPAAQRRRRRSPLLPARPQNRPRTRRQPLPNLRHRTRRPHHQAGHHAVHREPGIFATGSRYSICPVLSLQPPLRRRARQLPHPTPAILSP